MNESRKVSPPRDQLSQLRAPLNEGERRVFGLFDEHLAPAWEIYVQPHLNRQRPDFVLLNPNAGVAVFEVKDWNLEAMDYWVEKGANGLPRLMARSPALLEQVAELAAEVVGSSGLAVAT